MYLRKQTIEELNLSELSTLPDDQLDSYVANQLRLATWQSWLPAQLVQHYSTWRILADGKSTVLANCKTKQQQGIWRLLRVTRSQLIKQQILADGKSTVLANCKNKQERGIWRLLRVTRSQLIKQQTKNSEYSQLVPLFLLSQKRYHGRAYESWRDYPGLEWLVEPELLQAIKNPKPRLTNLELQEILASGLTQLNGKSKNPVTTHRLTGIPKTGHPLSQLPRLQVVMITQIWLAHPSVRHSDMILDSDNWDHMPRALVNWQTIPDPIKENTTTTTPWATV